MFYYNTFLFCVSKHKTILKFWMKPLIQFNTLLVQFNMCTGSALVRIHSIQRVEDLMPALHATTLKYQLNEHYSYSSMLQGLNAYLFLGHFPVKKKLKISITFCPVDSVRHARIHNLCCQQFSIKGGWSNWHTQQCTDPPLEIPVSHVFLSLPSCRDSRPW